MSQVARNLSDGAEGFLMRKRYLIHDRDPLFTEEFSKIIQASDRIREVIAELAELECPRGALRENHQGILLGADDSVRRKLAAESHSRICGALPS